jgi:Fe/S biogenesis protein NfuA
MMAGMSEDREDIAPVLAITPEARATVLEVLANESESDTLALWLEVSGEAGGAYTYDMYFQALADAGSGDVVQSDDVLPVVVPSTSVDRLQGATLDFVTDASGEGGLVIVNPNTPTAPTLAGLGSIPEVDMSDPFAQRVVAVLEQQVNPSIASHGGRADLVAVEDTSVYLRLSGGCQGCGMAKATLSQGIEVILREAIPEIANVVDVTDHADGTNPYYEPAHS